MIILALAGGVLGLFASVALRSPARRSSIREGLIDDKFTYLSLPGFSYFLIGVGVLGLVVPGVTAGAGGLLLIVVAAGAGIFVALGLVMSVWGLFGKTVPAWALPRTKK